jgi:hypothetical protein
MKRAMLIGAALAASLVANNAAAFDFGTPEQKRPFQSAQNFALEFRFGPYLPDVDKEPGLKGTPFKNSFGTGDRIYLGLEFDWQMYRIPGIGTIGPAFQVGRVEMGRDAVTITGRKSGDSYSLTVYPLVLDAVLRADILWRAVGIPIVPYAKLGMALGIWNASNSGGTAHADGAAGNGGSWGPAFTGGVAFPLNFFDYGASRGMDNSTGINTTNLFVEYDLVDINGLGQSHPLYVGDNTWVAGMMFEF